MSVQSRRIFALSMFRSAFTLAGLAVGLTACGPQEGPVAPAEALALDTPSTLNLELARVRAATARFHDVNVALAEGYAPVSPCVAVPGVGAMGIHFLKMPLVMDAGFTPTEPEALLYEPRSDGSLQLVGVEYVVVQAAWHGAGNADLPHFEGHAFQAGPASGEAPATYTLHAWTWRPNPAGPLEPFNARVSCPTGAGGHAH